MKVFTDSKVDLLSTLPGLFSVPHGLYDTINFPFSNNAMLKSIDFLGSIFKCPFTVLTFL